MGRAAAGTGGRTRISGAFFPDAEFAVTRALIRVGGVGRAPVEAESQAEVREGEATPRDAFVGELPPPPVIVLLPVPP